MSITLFEKFYVFCLDLLSKLGNFANSVLEWLTTDVNFGGTELTIIDLLFGSGLTLVLAFLLAKIIINIVI